MKALNLLVIKLTLCLIAGIYLAHFFHFVDLTFSIYAFSSSFLGLFIFQMIALRQFKKTIWFGLFAYLATLSLGSLIYTLHQQRNFKNHYTQFISATGNSQDTLKFKVRQRLKPSPYHEKYIVQLIEKNHQPVNGKLLLNVNKDSLETTLKVDDILMTVSQLSEIRKPLNPYQFDYSAYMERKYIYHQVFVPNRTLFKLKASNPSLIGYAAKLRLRINTVLKAYEFKKEELDIINALLLGQRQDMSKGMYANYVNAGAIHILAVSGLHVGIILMLLNFCLKPIENISHGKLIKVILILLILWAYAVVAGLSASVTRAVTMFSILAIAINSKRPTNIYNSIAISIFVLLLFKPMFLFDVGFQLSYVAVFGIVSIQPILSNLWYPKWKLISYLWNIFTVTMAAQIGVLPISLFYFHQFPGLFFISNLLIIPFLGVILGIGICVIILALLNALPEFLASSYAFIINTMNAIISSVSAQEGFLFQQIAFNLEHVIAYYFLIWTAFNYFKRRNFRTLAMLLISIICLQSVWFYTKYKPSDSEFIVFHKSRSSLLGLRSNTELKLFHDLDSANIVNDNTIKNYRIGQFIKRIDSDSLEAVYSINNAILLIIDSLGVYDVKSFQPDYILLRNSPRINLERLIDSLRPSYIIADGSNYKSYIKRWEETCKKQKLPFHHTGTKGAFILKHQFYSDSLNSGLNAK